MLYHNKQWIDDIDIVLNNILDLNCLRGKNVLITGASGLICSTVVDIILRYNEVCEGQIQIYAAGRSKSSMMKRFGDMTKRTDLHFVRYDATKINNAFEFNSDYIIHGAGNAYPGRVMQEPVETMVGNIFGIKSLLDYARNISAKRVLYISSSEVYGKNENGNALQESEYGYVDLLNTRSAYPNGKRAAETLCIAYKSEYGIDSVIARPGHIYGPTATLKDNRVSSQWPYMASRGDNIVLKSDGRQLRSYVYCVDCASAILTILTKGKSGCAYNISNSNSVLTIREMAEILVKYTGVRLIVDLPTGEEIKGFNPMSNSSLDATNLYHLGWRGCFDADMGFQHTIDIIKENS